MSEKRASEPKSPPRHEPEPVMGTSVLFVGEESIGHVENFFSSSDVDRAGAIRRIDAKPPVLDPSIKWYGDGSSDP